MHVRACTVGASAGACAGGLCASSRLQRRLPGHSAHVAGRSGASRRYQGWVDTRLYFGLGAGRSSRAGMSEADWRGFLDREVTPRFPVWIERG